MRLSGIERPEMSSKVLVPARVSFIVNCLKVERPRLNKLLMHVLAVSKTDVETLVLVGSKKRSK